MSMEAIKTATMLVSNKILFTLFEITSIENKIPAIGLPNKAVIPAAIPAQTNCVLYFLKKMAFCCANEPIVAEATTVETSMPVEPPKMTVKKPLIKCDGIL